MIKPVEIDAIVNAAMRSARIPGVALAVVKGAEIIFSGCYGVSDLAAGTPMTTATRFPIASLTKGMNAALLASLSERGLFDWDAPVQTYIPEFRLADANASAAVTTRDLVVMRTGLPRHDWSWEGVDVSRPDLVHRLRFQQPSAEFRDRFQYNNLTVTAAGHVAEWIMGEDWETLAHSCLFEPLGMNATTPTRPAAPVQTAKGYFENRERVLVEATHLAGESTAPSGGSVHATIEDMARWVRFNLGNGEPLFAPGTLRELHTPQIVVGKDSSAPSPNAMYALGWFIDMLNGRLRISHGGYLHDVNSNIMLFPEAGLGLVSFTSFGPTGLASLINEHVFAAIEGGIASQSFEQKLAVYEARIAFNESRFADACLAGNSPPREPASYAGRYRNPGYGDVVIERDRDQLIWFANGVRIPLAHHRHDVWGFTGPDLFPIHKPHPFDRAGRMLFDTDFTGEVAGLRIALELAVAPIRFVKSEGLTA